MPLDLCAGSASREHPDEVGLLAQHLTGVAFEVGAGTVRVADVADDHRPVAEHPGDGGAEEPGGIPAGRHDWHRIVADDSPQTHHGAHGAARVHNVPAAEGAERPVDGQDVPDVGALCSG